MRHAPEIVIFALVVLECSASVIMGFLGDILWFLVCSSSHQSFILGSHKFLSEFFIFLFELFFLTDRLINFFILLLNDSYQAFYFFLQLLILTKNLHNNFLKSYITSISYYFAHLSINLPSLQFQIFLLNLSVSELSILLLLVCLLISIPQLYSPL